MTAETMDLDEAVRLALKVCYSREPRIDAVWHADEDGRFRPTTIADAFEIVLGEIEKQGWVYEHASFLSGGERHHSFWVGEPDPTAEMEITKTLAGETTETYPTRLLAGCIAFVEAVANALPEQGAEPA